MKIYTSDEQRKKDREISCRGKEITGKSNKNQKLLLEELWKNTILVPRKFPCACVLNAKKTEDGKKIRELYGLYF